MHFTEHTRFFSSARIFNSGTKKSVQVQPEIPGPVGLFYNSNTTAYRKGCAAPVSPVCKAHRPEELLGKRHLNRPASPGTLRYGSRGNDRCPAQHITAPCGSPKPGYGQPATPVLVAEGSSACQPRYNGQFCSFLADVARKDLTLKLTVLYPSMSPQHKVFYKNLPFTGNITGNLKKYGKKMVTSLSFPEPYIFNTASNPDFRTIVPAGE